jgi:hypothetical protein
MSVSRTATKEIPKAVPQLQSQQFEIEELTLTVAIRVPLMPENLD